MLVLSVSVRRLYSVGSGLLYPDINADYVYSYCGGIDDPFRINSAAKMPRSAPVRPLWLDRRRALLFTGPPTGAVARSPALTCSSSSPLCRLSSAMLNAVPRRSPLHARLGDRRPPSSSPAPICGGRILALGCARGAMATDHLVCCWCGRREKGVERSPAASVRGGVRVAPASRAVAAVVLVLELLLSVVGMAAAGAAVGKKVGSDSPHLLASSYLLRSVSHQHAEIRF